ncbi:uncharacterized protein I206_107724 [Kwoniella pini CBS 10737]|uniref:Uncharacterized protein n=1 Tax=Kwoniella pini CBS 10737 TaxID=1296096 RepID=A0A1B9HY48_9TREE|nr:uncharacterized protein I206_06058 [Kwoniella pini CBS 10737]OCF48190.1 hypothetical protein I206_06058 [Kwoniella pini CBS 10737]
MEQQAIVSSVISDPTGRDQSILSFSKDTDLLTNSVNLLSNGHPAIQSMASHQSTPKLINFDDQQIPDSALHSHLPTPSLTSNSTVSNSIDPPQVMSSSSSVSTSSVQEKSQKTNSPPNTITAPRSLSSLEKLRQFKAEVEATRNNSKAANISSPNINIEETEMNPGKLAKMAESFILQQQQIKKENNPITSTSTVGENDFILSDREKALKEQLKLRSAQSQSRSPTSGSKRIAHNDSKAPSEEMNFSKRSRGDSGIQGQLQTSDQRRYPTLPANPPWNERNQDKLQKSPVASHSTTRAGSSSERNSNSAKFQPPHPNDPRFTRREVSTGSAGSVEPDYKPSDTNFVSSRFLRSGNGPHPMGRDSGSPPSRAALSSDSRGKERERNEFDRSRGYDGQRLADRISTKSPGPPHKYRQRSPSPTRPAPRAYSRGHTPPHERRGQGRPPSPPRQYPDPRTPVSPHQAGRDQYIGAHEQYGDPRMPLPPPPRTRPEIHERLPSPVHARLSQRGLPPEDYMEGRYLSAHRGVPFARHPPSAPTPEYGRPPIVNHHHDRSPVPNPLVAAGIDTNNVVETLQALKAQISKLEKLVPTTAALQPQPHHPPSQRGHEYDPYTEYARQYGHDRPREPHPREREYDSRPPGPPGHAYPPHPHGIEGRYEDERRGLPRGPPSPRGHYGAHEDPYPRPPHHPHDHVHRHGEFDGPPGRGRGGKGQGFGHGGGRGKRGRRGGRGH